MTKDEFYKHLTDILKACAAVVVVAICQAVISYVGQWHPEIVTGTSQLGAAFASLKFLKF